jgi:integrase
VRITIDRKTYYIATGIKVLRSEWVAGAVCNRPDADVLNRRVRVIYNKVMQEVDDCIEAGEEFDLAEIRRNVWKVSEMESDSSMLDWLDDQVRLLNVTDGTRKHYNTLLVRLMEYDRMKSWRDVSVENIYMWDAWLHQLPAQGGGLISDGGVYTYHKCLKALLNRAKDFGRISENPYERLRGKFSRGDKENVEYLTEDEMKRFLQLKLPEGSKMEMAHDLFTFQMFTGLAFSDAMAFDIEQYRYDSKTKTWKNVGQRIKTGVAYVSQLLPPAVEVLYKYGMKVPKMDNADYNHALKLLGEVAGIATPLHSHLARHTFATYMLSNGAKIENVSRMLGHTNITQTQRYAKVLAKDVHDDFDKIAKKLKSKK